MILAQILIAKAKALHHPRREILGQHICSRDQPPQDCFSPSVLRSSTMPRLLRFIIRNAAVSSPIFGGIMWRESSPLGAFSILMTSAPMSASISVQVGPAMTCVRSITRKPVNGPIGQSCLLADLFARPLGLALVEEGIQSFTEVSAHVAHEDKVFALLAREPALQPRERLFRGVERQRRVAGNQRRKLVDPPLQGGKVIHDFVENANACRLLGADEPCGEYEILHARGSDQRRKPAEARHGKAVAERAGDRKSHSRRLGPDAHIAASGDPSTAAGAGAGDRGDRGHAALLERRQHAIDARFVFDRMLGRLEGAKLIDVGARCKGLVAGALEYEHLDRAVLVGLLAYLREPLVHREGEGIARLRTVEYGAPNTVLHLEQEVTGARGLLIHAILVLRPVLNAKRNLNADMGESKPGAACRLLSRLGINARTAAASRRPCCARP